MASGRPAALSSEVTRWSSLSAAIAAPLGPPDRSTSSGDQPGVAFRVVADLADMEQPA